MKDGFLSFHPKNVVDCQTKSHVIRLFRSLVFGTRALMMFT